MIVRTSLALGAILVALSGTAARAQDASDLLLATLWTQRSVEYKANALTVFALARIRLDEALARLEPLLRQVLFAEYGVGADPKLALPHTEGSLRSLRRMALRKLREEIDDLS